MKRRPSVNDIRPVESSSGPNPYTPGYDKLKKPRSNFPEKLNEEIEKRKAALKRKIEKGQPGNK